MSMRSTKKLWLILTLVMITSFGILGLLGREIHLQAPPVPARIVSDDGTVLFTRADVQIGRQAWQSAGGMQLGSIWGHGAYLAPDWSADWLHRESVALLDGWSQAETGKPFAQLDNEHQAALQARLKQEMATNRYDPETGDLFVSVDRAAAIRAVASHYVDLFGDAPALSTLREQYAMPENAMPDVTRRTAMSAFFFWTSWATAAERPGDPGVTYTNNWPHEPLLGHAPTTGAVVWSVLSVILLIAGVGALVWYHAVTTANQPHAKVPATDPLAGLKPTPSMRATGKYFATVIALFLVQIGLGSLTAHYGVEGQDFYGFPIADYLPYAVTRTWHTQLAVFWIATAWLATGLYIAPAISGHEPRFQRLGTNLLYVALLIVVVGSMAGEWLAVQQKMGLDINFWLGHQGYEYVDLGRFWQILLFAGLGIWLVLVGRALWPALRHPSESQPLLVILFLSTVAIGLFYGAGLTWGQHTRVQTHKIHQTIAATRQIEARKLRASLS
jgi:nitric oxide reductase subunit B